MRTKVRKFLCTLGLIVLLLAIAVLLGWRKEFRSMASLERVGDNPYLYVMNYEAEYDLDDMVNRDLDRYGELLGYAVARGMKILPTQWVINFIADKLGKAHFGGCTSFQAENADGSGYLFGRNYDNYENLTLVTLSRPKNGYASIAVSDMAFIGFYQHHLPKSFLGKINCLGAIYIPLDGINEKGLCASILALPAHFASQKDTPRHDVGTSTIVRLLLDRCATVDEALALLETVDVRHDTEYNAAFHYMVADAAGNSAVIEFDPQDGWNTLVVRKPADKSHFQVTNHMLAPAYWSPEPDPSVGNIDSQSWWRMQVVTDFLTEKGGRITPQEALDCLAHVRWIDMPTDDETRITGTQYRMVFDGLSPNLEMQPEQELEDTQYSLVYDQGRIALTLRNWNDYDTAHRFSL